MFDNIDDLKRYYSIGEVAELFDISKSLIRFWEGEFHRTSRRHSALLFAKHRIQIGNVRVGKQLFVTADFSIANLRGSFSLGSSHECH